MNEKQIVGEKAAEFVKDGMVVGLGTGSTVFYTICKLGELVKQGLSIRGCATSVQTEKLAKEWGIPLAKFAEIEQIDVAIDGADEVDSQLNLIKGGGGALLREKIIARAAKTFVVVADPSKLVGELGTMRLPVETISFAFELTMKHIARLGCQPQLRQSNGTPYKTDNGNYIFDCAFSGIPHPKELERNLNMIPGVVENGLFVKMADVVITLDKQKNIIMKKQGS
ncbi:ribose-5-phosphate isomerase RpiA [Aneurinibacillus sp. Ricciae_BoGa-3]|uniref:ribose-5-phosphate isomerase RpiA n=1 Tax=Aneurinibacillus sp. Ricciae_BoGa-3 TaxID=3022697 RepID=UPI0023422BA6|nr:ribose-5-phosphate isomerase RpiA [Aneurinibacillus sp. Ricciae_BoGa-3]WCK55790.1 ribose-5-phosphate isomerase RpiA [Aneurinibacillus sp. Ricciae_BoGa-3]